MIEASKKTDRSGPGTPETPLITVVVPAFNEEENVEEVVRRVGGAFGPASIHYEILFVDDGSTDRTPEILEGLAADDSRIRAIVLSRNFGHQMALTAGFENARGRTVALMDADLQDPPELLLEFLAQWRQGYDVVYGIRRHRTENVFKRLSYHAYYRLLAGNANIAIPKDSGDFSLMDRRIVDAINALPERTRFLRGLRAWLGLRQIGIPYERQARRAGKPKYTFRKLLSLASDGIVSFSVSPLQIATKLGFMISAASIIAAFVYVLRWALGFANAPDGFLTLVIVILLLFGVQFLLIGILGEYVGSIHAEVKGRPHFVEDRKIGFDEETSPDES